MASTKEYLDFVLQQLNLLEDITFKPMMGEYLIYYKGIYLGGVYDNRFLVKITKTNFKYSLSKDCPYKGAKDMYLVENIEDCEYLKDLVVDTVEGLKQN